MLGEGRPRAVNAENGLRAPATRAERAGDGVEREHREPGVWRDPVAWTIATLVFCAYYAVSLFRFLRLSPASWDLGIYTEYVKQLSLLRAPIVDVRGPGFDLLGDHFQIGLAVLAPFFRLIPSPATLLFFQALLTALSVFPVIAAGSLLLGRPSGRLIGFAYGFSWGLQQMIDFDFHEIALAVPLLAFSLSALVRGRVRATALWALPLVFIKEDQGFTVAAIGALLVFDGVSGVSGVSVWAAGPTRPGLPARRGSIGWGALLFGWGLTWSVLAIAVIIPHFNPLHEYYYWKDGGVVGGGNSGLSAGGLVVQTASGWPVKLQTVLMLLLPTAFAALGSPLALIALPSLALRFVSTNSAYWGTDWHYNATLMPILFIAAVEAIARWRAVGAGRGLLGGRVAGLAAGIRGGLARHGAADDGGRRGRARLPVPAQRPLAGLDVHDQPACGGRKRGDGGRPRRRDRAEHPRPAGAAGCPHRHLLDRQRGQPAHPVHRLRRREQRLQPGPEKRPGLHRRALPVRRLPPDLPAQRRLRLPPQLTTRKRAGADNGARGRADARRAHRQAAHPY